eukprot:TRINITY_DN27400_c0_g1_i1.p1 TRINITY_DN27400_c0_g1~~TRINITY_DN27400_c0_g1_i1.p1  ORF type:complete len:318 (-),score=93.69 TRINITY_DN27400_c0_g1_i1:66-1019(-)
MSSRRRRLDDEPRDDDAHALLQLLLCSFCGGKPRSNKTSAARRAQVVEKEDDQESLFSFEEESSAPRRRPSPGSSASSSSRPETRLKAVTEEKPGDITEEEQEEEQEEEPSVPSVQESIAVGLSSFGELVQATSLTVPTAFGADEAGGVASAPLPPTKSAAARMEESLLEVAGLARLVQASCQKYPKRGGGIFMSGVQNRFVAAVPAKDDGGDASAGGQSRTSLLQRWRNGRLAYWTDKEAFTKDQKDKGGVDLLMIAKVSMKKDDDSGLIVIVKHKLDNEMCELQLRFKTKREAEQWSYACWEFIAKLREVLKQEM